MRARMALAISATRYELREVRLSDKPPELLAASPKGTVPVLVLPDGTVIDESVDIMRWALGRDDPECWLTRDDPALIAACDGTFKHHLDRYKYPDRYGSDPRRHRAAGLQYLHELEQRLSRSTHLCGPDRGLTDAAIVPFVRQFAAVDSAWFDALPLTRVRAWLAHHLGSNLFKTIMKKQQWR